MDNFNHTFLRKFFQFSIYTNIKGAVIIWLKIKMRFSSLGRNFFLQNKK